MDRLAVVLLWQLIKKVRDRAMAHAMFATMAAASSDAPMSRLPMWTAFLMCNVMWHTLKMRIISTSSITEKASVKAALSVPV